MSNAGEALEFILNLSEGTRGCMYKNVVVGFDAREMWLDADSQWTQDRKDLRQKKDELLLKQDVLKPLSVDHYVWHSVFSELLEPRLWVSVARRNEYVGPEWDNVFSESRKLSKPDAYRRGGLWRSLIALQDYLHQSWGNVWKPCYLVAAVELLNDELDGENEEDGLEPISPDVVDSQWKLLGYDVADYELRSGLFNGVMSSEEAVRLRHDWNDHLNKYHLFIEPQKAFDYIAIANLRYPSHMPYYVYALYGIQEK
jgi:hypothetical protein